MTIPTASVFIGVMVGLFVLRLMLATVFFLWILPEADRCPICDSHTIRVRSPGWNRLFPRLRVSWCLHCGWEGLLRPADRPEAPAHVETRSAVGKR